MARRIPVDGHPRPPRHPGSPASESSQGKRATTTGVRGVSEVDRRHQQTIGTWVLIVGVFGLVWPALLAFVDVGSALSALVPPVSLLALGSWRAPAEHRPLVARTLAVLAALMSLVPLAVLVAFIASRAR